MVAQRDLGGSSLGEQILPNETPAIRCPSVTGGLTTDPTSSSEPPAAGQSVQRLSPRRRRTALIAPKCAAARQACTSISHPARSKDCPCDSAATGAGWTLLPAPTCNVVGLIWPPRLTHHQHLRGPAPSLAASFVLAA